MYSPHIHIHNICICVYIYSHFFKFSAFFLRRLWAPFAMGRWIRSAILIPLHIGIFDFGVSVQLFLGNLDFHRFDCKNHLASLVEMRL